MSEPCPQSIVIMPDYAADAYAWDAENGDCITPISDYFPKDIEIILIEVELNKWCAWFERDVDPFGDNKTFPWNDFHEQGRSLAKRLAQALKKYAIEVYYQLPYEDPKGEDSEAIKIEV